ncbi:MAG: hypothetical protein J7K00_00690 [Candidatus Diapherotrites archaeon]|nr:hypothetical protein [Candidatus Diapherotrites archaeon]
MKKIEKMTELLDEIQGQIAEGASVIVEGRRDKENLMSLGIKGEIITISQSGESWVHTIEKSNITKAIILTDFDRTGERLKERLAQLLYAQGAEADIKTRSKIRSLVGISTFETLYGSVEKLRAE